MNNPRLRWSTRVESATRTPPGTVNVSPALTATNSWQERSSRPRTSNLIAETAMASCLPSAAADVPSLSQVFFFKFLTVTFCWVFYVFFVPRRLGDVLKSVYWTTVNELKNTSLFVYFGEFCCGYTSETGSLLSNKNVTVKYKNSERCSFCSIGKHFCAVAESLVTFAFFCTRTCLIKFLFLHIETHFCKAYSQSLYEHLFWIVWSNFLNMLYCSLKILMWRMFSSYH